MDPRVFVIPARPSAGFPFDSLLPMVPAAKNGWAMNLPLSESRFTQLSVLRLHAWDQSLTDSCRWPSPVGGLVAFFLPPKLIFS
jgi:hypothetical protein